MTRKRITVFGSSCFSEDDPRYSDVVRLGKALANAGWDALIGGHQGMMAAFSDGMRKGGGHIRGVTLECFPTPPGNHLSEEIRARDFFHRMQTLIEETDAYLVLHGGLGTLAELAMSWDLLAIRILEPRPLILFGDAWPAIIDVLQKHLTFSVEDAFSFIHSCNSPEDVIDRLSSRQ